MNELKTIDGKDFQKSYFTNMSRVAFCSRELKCEANLDSIKNKMRLNNEIMKRLEKLKGKSEKKGSAIVSSYLIDLEDEMITFDENKLENMELLVNIWDDYSILNKTHQILVNECIELLEKLKDIKLNKMKKIDEESNRKISKDVYKIKKFLVNIGEDAEGNTLFSFLRCSVYHLLELRDDIRLNNKDKYKERIELLIDFIDNWDSI